MVGMATVIRKIAERVRRNMVGGDTVSLRAWERLVIVFWSFVLLLVSVFLSSSGADEKCLDFSFKPSDSGLPQDWKPLTFPKIARHTSYTLESSGKNFWVKAESRNSASALVREIRVDPKVYPILRWRWRVENVIQKGDEKKKEADDYAARVYVNFRYDPEKASLWERTQYALAYGTYGHYPPKGALNYIWANKIERGQVVDSAYTSKSKMIAVESGPERIGAWVSEERNIHRDYVSYFGEDPPEVIAIAIMTDTDNTGEKAVAYYEDMTLCSN